MNTEYGFDYMTELTRFDSAEFWEMLTGMLSAGRIAQLRQMPESLVADLYGAAYRDWRVQRFIGIATQYARATRDDFVLTN